MSTSRSYSMIQHVHPRVQESAFALMDIELPSQVKCWAIDFRLLGPLPGPGVLEVYL